MSPRDMSSATRRPDIFVSATSGDLGHIRELAKQALLSIDCHPVEQTNFPPDYRSVEEMLRAKISACDAVLHIVGIRYGAEPDPDTLPDNAVRQSYTQMEARLARELGKKLYLFLCPDDFPYGGFPAESEEKQALQHAYRQQVRHDRQLRTTITGEADVQLRVRELQTQIESLRHTVSTLEDTVASSRRSHNRLLALGSLGLVVLLGLGALVFHLTRRSDQQSADNLRIEKKLDQTLSSFSKERELLTKVLDVSLRRNAELENLTPRQRFDLALREVAIEKDIPAEQLQSTLDLYAAKVKALGDQADYLDRVLVSEKGQQFERAVQIAEEGLATLEKQRDDFAKSERTQRNGMNPRYKKPDNHVIRRHELLMAKGRSLEAQYIYQKAAETYRQAGEILAPEIHPQLWDGARSSQIRSRHGAGIPARHNNEDATPGKPAPVGVTMLTAALEVENERGDKIYLNDEKNSLICAMATWCPYSRAFEVSLNTPELKEATKHLKIIYVYCDEWPAVRNMLEEKEGSEAGAEQYKKMKNDAFGSVVFDAAHLKEIKKPFFFIPVSSEVKPKNYPSSYDFDTKSYGKNPLLWLVEDARIDPKLVMEAAKKGRKSQGIE